MTTPATQLTITIPDGAPPGSVLNIPIKGGQENVKARVPEGLGPGSTLVLTKLEGSDEWVEEVGEVRPAPATAVAREEKLQEKAAPVSSLEMPPPPGPPAQVDGPVAYTVRLDTTVGIIDIIVRPDWAPHGARRFLDLAAIGDLDDLAFYRSVKGCLAQFGLPAKRPWPPLPDDPPTGVPFLLGAVCFAAVGKNSRKSTLFICIGDMSHCFGQESWETPIGAVAESSLDVLDRIETIYGDIAECNGAGPDTGRINVEGNAYLRADYPLLTYIRSAWPLDWQPPFQEVEQASQAQQASEAAQVAHAAEAAAVATRVADAAEAAEAARAAQFAQVASSGRYQGAAATASSATSGAPPGAGFRTSAGQPATWQADALSSSGRHGRAAGEAAGQAQRWNSIDGTPNRSQAVDVLVESTSSPAGRGSLMTDALVEPVGSPAGRGAPVVDVPVEIMPANARRTASFRGGRDVPVEANSWRSPMSSQQRVPAVGSGASPVSSQQLSGPSSPLPTASAPLPRSGGPPGSTTSWAPAGAGRNGWTGPAPPVTTSVVYDNSAMYASPEYSRRAPSPLGSRALSPQPRSHPQYGGPSPQPGQILNPGRPPYGPPDPQLAGAGPYGQAHPPPYSYGDQSFSYNDQSFSYGHPHGAPHGAPSPPPMHHQAGPPPNMYSPPGMPPNGAPGMSPGGGFGMAPGMPHGMSHGMPPGMPLGQQSPPPLLSDVAKLGAAALAPENTGFQTPGPPGFPGSSPPPWQGMPPGPSPLDMSFPPGGMPPAHHGGLGTMGLSLSGPPPGGGWPMH